MGDRTKAKDSKTPILSDDAVRDFLTRRPDFFVDHADILTELNFPAATQNPSVIDFQQHAMGSLRRRISELGISQGDLISTARFNAAAQNRIHEAVLTILDTENIKTFLHILTEQWPDILGIDAVSLSLESDASKIHMTLDGVQMLSQGRIDHVLGSDQAILICARDTGDIMLFGPAAPLIQSQALVRLDCSPSLRGLLALGSRYPQTFLPGQPNELLRFLARVVEKILTRRFKELAA